MKRKYLEICFRQFRNDFDSVLTDEEKEGFYKKHEGMRWMASDEETDKKLRQKNASSIFYLEMWIGYLIDYLAKVGDGKDGYTENLKKCKYQ